MITIQMGNVQPKPAAERRPPQWTASVHHQEQMKARMEKHGEQQRRRLLSASVPTCLPGCTPLPSIQDGLADGIKSTFFVTLA